MTQPEPVSFRSGDQTCAGYLFLPARASGRLPCVVLAHGVSGTMDRLFPQATAFAAAGLAALVFDYRGFGESLVEPPFVLDLARQRDDLRAAIAFARADPRVDPDRILLWGNSLGGAHVITVAVDDPRVVAVVSQIPYAGSPRTVEGRSAWAAIRLTAAIVWDGLRGAVGLRPFYIPMLGRPGELAVVSDDESEQHLRVLAGEQGETNWRNTIAPRGLLAMARYRPADDAARLTRPLLVCIATRDREAPPELTSQLAERAPRGELLRYEGSHFTFYSLIRDEVVADQLAFFRRQLAAVAG